MDTYELTYLLITPEGIFAKIIPTLFYTVAPNYLKYFTKSSQQHAIGLLKQSHISLLSITGKVFARILLNWLSKLAENILLEAQCRFSSGRGTVNMIFLLKQIQKRCIEQNRPLYMALNSVDFTKVFDTVHGETLWKLLLEIGCPNLFTDLIASLHKDTKASVSLKGEYLQPLDVQIGVKQGCMLAPTLFFNLSFQSPESICRL